jgi:hypothetical protein
MQQQQQQQQQRRRSPVTQRRPIGVRQFAQTET